MPAITLEMLDQALLVLDLGSFRRAAEVLGVQPSVVSRRIRAFEDVLGVSLFQRQTQGAQPTPAGRRVLRRARRVIDEVALLVQMGRRAGDGSEGDFCVGVVASIAGGGARDLLKRFLSERSLAEVNVVEGSPRDHIGEIQALRMDCAFVVGAPSAARCRVETLWTEPIMVVLPESHKLADAAVIEWPELQDERFLVSRMDPGPEIQDYIVQHLAGLGHHPLVEPRQVGRDALLALIGLGLGISLVSGAEAAVSYPGVVFRPLDDDLLPYSVVWSEQNDNPMLRRFMSLARRWSGERKAASDALARRPDRSP